MCLRVLSTRLRTLYERIFDVFASSQSFREGLTSVPVVISLPLTYNFRLTIFIWLRAVALYQFTSLLQNLLFQLFSVTKAGRNEDSEFFKPSHLLRFCQDRSRFPRTTERHQDCSWTCRLALRPGL